MHHPQVTPTSRTRQPKICRYMYDETQKQIGMDMSYRQANHGTGNNLERRAIRQQPPKPSKHIKQPGTRGQTHTAAIISAFLLVRKNIFFLQATTCCRSHSSIEPPGFSCPPPSPPSPVLHWRLLPTTRHERRAFHSNPILPRLPFACTQPNLGVVASPTSPSLTIIITWRRRTWTTISQPNVVAGAACEEVERNPEPYVSFGRSYGSSSVSSTWLSSMPELPPPPPPSPGISPSPPPPPLPMVTDRAFRDECELLWIALPMWAWVASISKVAEAGRLLLLLA